MLRPMGSATILQPQNFQHWHSLSNLLLTWGFNAFNISVSKKKSNQKLRKEWTKIIWGYGQDKLTKDQEILTDSAATSCRITVVSPGTKKKNP